MDQLPEFLDYITSQPQLKRATHCMYAYRTFKQNLKEPNHHGLRAQAVSAMPPSKSTVLTGQKDGGESGSGDRLARLLQDTRSDNVVLVVSRWYGGIQLGNDRWKRINQVAKEALQKGNFPRPKEGPASSNSASSSKKRRR
ncbi:ribosomal protein S5 domain 2-like protein [Pleurotus eryngii]|uniref:Ribosomal protein S5 domain 2-like protein n=1 Tax=Pleurotus eryngii TaxID=5323 RepID=A0A9P6DGN3_PLEER|nr:ribosomal protein S5 domain 2-like protein [Pleurotus eryngii]